MTLTDRQLAIVLAALRLQQGQPGAEYRDLATLCPEHFDGLDDRSPVTAEEIDALCEELNGPQEPESVGEIMWREGWSTSTVLDMAVDFIDSRDYAYDFRAYLERQAKRDRRPAICPNCRQHRAQHKSLGACDDCASK
ncbi:MAG: hypothetical protein GX785_02215 [Armatimonadetes bacterium]|nr:hypothetical protein [Armatimonadota bacterium]